MCLEEHVLDDPGKMLRVLLGREQAVVDGQHARMVPLLGPYR